VTSDKVISQHSPGENEENHWKLKSSLVEIRTGYVPNISPKLLINGARWCSGNVLDFHLRCTRFESRQATGYSE
jgi:hypothetical protein